MSMAAKNTGDEAQVKKAEIKRASKRQEEIRDLELVMSSRQGRRFLFRLLSHCRTFQSIYDETNRIHYNAGRQDVGHFLVEELEAASKDGFIKVLTEQDE